MRTEQKVAVITGASQGIGAGALAYVLEMRNPPQTLSGNIKRLMEMGLQSKPDVEQRLAYYTGALGQ